MTYNDVIRAAKMIAELRELDEMIVVVSAPRTFIRISVFSEGPGEPASVNQITLDDLIGMLAAKRKAVAAVLSGLFVYPDPPVPIEREAVAALEAPCDGRTSAELAEAIAVEGLAR